MKIYLDYDFANLNKIIDVSRTHYQLANNLKKKEMNVVKLMTLRQRPIENYPVKITFIWHFKDKHRDLDNCVPKNILDSLVSAKILKNDNLNCIREITHKSIIDGKNGVEVIIEDYN